MLCEDVNMNVFTQFGSTAFGTAYYVTLRSLDSVHIAINIIEKTKDT